MQFPTITLVKVLFMWRSARAFNMTISRSEGCRYKASIYIYIGMKNDTILIISSKKYLPQSKTDINVSLIEPSHSSSRAFSQPLRVEHLGQASRQPLIGKQNENSHIHYFPRFSHVKCRQKLRQSQA